MMHGSTMKTIQAVRFIPFASPTQMYEFICLYRATYQAPLILLEHSMNS
jgi:hypothetical protein